MPTFFFFANKLDYSLNGLIFFLEIYEELLDQPDVCPFSGCY